MSINEDGDVSASCCGRFKSEFCFKNLQLKYDRPGEFGRSHFGVSVLYLVWRLVWSVYNVGMIGVSVYLSQFYVSRPDNRLKWPIYSTNWGLVFNAVTSILDVAIAVHFYFNRRELLKGKEDPMPRYCQAFWILANISYTKAFVVTSAYWTINWQVIKRFDDCKILPLLSHGMNLVYVVLNLLVTAMPVKLFHAYIPIMECVVYVIFNAVYVTSGGTDERDKPYIYEMLDWKTFPALSAGVAFASVAATFLAHLIVYLIFYFRVHMLKGSKSSRVEVLSD